MPKLHHLCFVVVALVLVLVAICAPLYAFVLVSCVSTRPCKMGALLYNIGAQCAEGGGLRSESMLHSETCTLQCSGDFVPTVPVLTCVDGTLDGAQEGLACSPPIIYDNRPLASGLVTGAVTGGNVLDACLRAKDLECDARFGGSAVLVQLPNVREDVCQELFAECQSLSNEFDYMQHTKNPDPKPGFELLGTCTLGCFEEILPEEDLSKVQLQQPAVEDETMFAGASTAAGDPNADTCADGPVCVDVSGSCNEADNGDYFRYPTCTSGFTSWVQADKSHRIRYDGTPAYSQGGKWILEQGAVPNLDSYGLRIARQPSFFTFPLMGERMWRVRCRRNITTVTFQETFEWLRLTLGNCSCTDEQDCSGNGTAYGDKLSGPNCKCICDTGYKGDNCEIKMCKTPDVLFAATPACMEGRWLDPGQNCTPACNPGYEPSYPFFTCGKDGRFPADRLFQCIQKVTMGDDDLADDLGADQEFKTTTLGPCTDADCSYRGRAVGLRFRNGTCLCECMSNFTGMDCSGWVGSCLAPRAKTIANSYFTTCEEGNVIKGSKCTTRCAEGFMPAPTTLECRGTELDPPTYKCIGTVPVFQIWCETIKYIAIGASCIASLSLLMMCYFFGETPKREVKSFIAGRQLVEVGTDEEGKFNLVRMECSDMRSKLPRSAISAMAPALAITNNRPLEVADSSPGGFGKDPLAITSGVVASSALERHNQEGGDLRELARVAAEAGAQKAIEVGPLLLEDSPYASRGHYSPSPGVYADDESYDLAQLPGAPDSVQADGPEGVLVVQHTIEEEDDDIVAPPLPSGRFRPGQQVALAGLIGYQSLNGAQGILVEYDYAVGLWIVELEGFEDDPKRIPEKNLLEIQLSIHEAIATRSEWHFEMHALTEKAEAAQRERAAEAKFKAGATARAAEEFRRSSLAASMDRRQSIEEGIREAFANADAEALRTQVERAKELLEELKHCGAGDKASLLRLLPLAESRLEQHDERERQRAAKKRYEDRVKSGLAADWKMTPKQFWKFVEEGNMAKVSGGLKSKMPLSTRTTDGRRHGIIHVACKRVHQEALAGEEQAANRLAVVEALLKARANANAVDASDLTPLDLAVAECGEDASRPEVRALLDSLKALGLMTAAESAAELRAQSAAGGGEGHPSPT